MGNLAEMSDSSKVEFLMTALEDAGEVLRNAGYVTTGTRYINYVREMRGEPKGNSNE